MFERLSVLSGNFEMSYFIHDCCTYNKRRLVKCQCFTFQFITKIEMKTGFVQTNGQIIWNLDAFKYPLNLKTDVRFIHSSATFFAIFRSCCDTETLRCEKMANERVNFIRTQTPNTRKSKAMMHKYFRFCIWNSIFNSEADTEPRKKVRRSNGKKWKREKQTVTFNNDIINLHISMREVFQVQSMNIKILLHFLNQHLLLAPNPTQCTFYIWAIQHPAIHTSNTCAHCIEFDFCNH